MFSNWKRPRGSCLDQLWKEFTAGTCERFHIRQLEFTKEWKKQCMDILNGYFLEDPFLSALGLNLEQESLDSLRHWVKMYLIQDLTYGCFLQCENGGDEFLVAIDVLYVRHIRDEFPIPDKTHGKGFNNCIKFIKAVERNIRYPEGRRFCSYLTSFGVIIRPEYRGRDIEKFMIMNRVRVARKLCINLIGAVFIGKEMQAIAKKLKYRVLKKLNEKILLKECGLDFGAKAFNIAIMVRRKNC